MSEPRNGWCPDHATEFKPGEKCPMCVRPPVGFWIENDRWWQVYSSAIGGGLGKGVALDMQAKNSADLADAAIAEAKKRGRV